jgi:glutathione peroxidase-family protein
MADAYEFEAESITGETVGLDKFRDSVSLVVNVASQ